MTRRDKITHLMQLLCRSKITTENTEMYERAAREHVLEHFPSSKHSTYAAVEVELHNMIERYAEKL